MVAGVFFLLVTLAAPAHADGDGDALHGLLILGGLSALCFWQFFRCLRRARAIEDTPTGKVASAPQGRIELHGVAEHVAGRTLACPLTNTVCVWYRYTVERHQRRGKKSEWVIVESGRSAELFYLRDETGAALVHPGSAEITAKFRRQWRGASPRPTAPFGETGFFAGAFGSYRYTEEMIFPGDSVYALGWFQTRTAGPTGPSRAARLQALKADQNALLSRYDRDKDGHISAEEWDAACAAVDQDLAAAAAAAPPALPVHTMSMPADGDTPYLISTVPQAELAARYRRKTFFFLLGFLGAGAWAVSMIPILLR